MEMLSVRAIANDEELRRWSELCSRGFSHKVGTSATRFYNRYIYDPLRRLDWVRVTVTPEGQFVGSVRLLDRIHEMLDDETVRSCGLGEGRHVRGEGMSRRTVVDLATHTHTHTHTHYSEFVFSGSPPRTLLQCALSQSGVDGE
jgi:hypothetical protein